MAICNNESTRKWTQEIEVPAPLISYIYRTTQRYFARELNKYHLGWGHFAILMAVYEMDGPSQDSIALSRGFNKTMVAKSVIRLEEEKLIIRVPDANDRRVKKLLLTDKGKKILPTLLQVGQILNNSLLEGLDDTASSQSIEFLRRIALNVSQL